MHHPCRNVRAASGDHSRSPVAGFGATSLLIFSPGASRCAQYSFSRWVNSVLLARLNLTRNGRAGVRVGQAFQSPGSSGTPDRKVLCTGRQGCCFVEIINIRAPEASSCRRHNWKLASHGVAGKASKNPVPAGRRSSSVLSGRQDFSTPPPDTLCLANFRGRSATRMVSTMQLESRPYRQLLREHSFQPRNPG